MKYDSLPVVCGAGGGTTLDVPSAWRPVRGGDKPFQGPLVVKQEDGALLLCPTATGIRIETVDTGSGGQVRETPAAYVTDIDDKPSTRESDRREIARRMQAKGIAPEIIAEITSHMAFRDA